MIATFFQQCDPALGKSIRDSSIGEPIVEHIRQNRHKRAAASNTPRMVNHLLRAIVEANLPQRITDFAFTKQTLAASCVSLPKAGEDDKLATKLLKRGGVWTARKPITKVHPKDVTHLMIRAEQAPILRFDMPKGEPSYFFLMP